MDARLILALLLWLPLACLGFEHKAWDELLKKHVVLLDDGRASQLRYSAMAHERGALKSYLDALSRVAPAEFAGWSRAEQMAFLINAYNAFTVEKILTRYPQIRSIWDFGRLIGNPFKDEFFLLLGEKRSLDWIEHESLRKNYGDPRVHYAVNCASVSCPMLREEAYAAARLDKQLEEQAWRFLSDRSRNRLRAPSATTPESAARSAPAHIRSTFSITIGYSTTQGDETRGHRSHAERGAAHPRRPRSARALARARP
jgi:hypothetical protein